MIELLAGGDVDAGRLWLEIPERYRRLILCDVPMALKRQAFTACMAASAEVALWRMGGKPGCLFWCRAISPGAKTAVLHFTPTRPLPVECRRAIWEEFAEATAMRCLICLIPATYRPVCKLAENMGFQRLARLPHACRLAGHGRIVDGLLYQWRKPL